MNAPFLWIILPILMGGFALMLINEHATAIFGGSMSLLLAGLAFVLPIDEALLIGPVSLKVASSVSFLGRSLVLSASDAPLLVMILACAPYGFLEQKPQGSPVG